VVLNRFTKESQIQTYEFLESRTKNFTTRQLTRFVLLQTLEVLLKDTAHRKESFPAAKIDSATNL